MIAFLDTETGGFSVSKNGVCEIALVAVDHNFNKIAAYATFLVSPALKYWYEKLKEIFKIE